MTKDEHRLAIVTGSLASLSTQGAAEGCSVTVRPFGSTRNAV
jgi:hypothetical protein